MKKEKKNKQFIEPVVGKTYVKIIKSFRYKKMEYLANKFYKNICNV